MHRREFLMGIPLLFAATPEPSRGEWVRCADMPVARSEMPATVLDGEIYVAGGFGAGSRADRYDPATDRWQRLADLPVETNHPGITMLGGRVIVAGGYAMNGASAHRGIWAYDPDDDAWEAIGELPEPMGAFGLTTLDDDLYLVGGALGSLNGEPSAAVWRWRAATGAGKGARLLPRPGSTWRSSPWASTSTPSAGVPMGGTAINSAARLSGTIRLSINGTRSPRCRILAVGSMARRPAIVWSWPAVRRAAGFCRCPDARHRRHTLGIAA